jgi:exodeoxyribonuclease V gamma subunit
VDVDIDLGGGRRLRGTVPDVYGDRILAASYSRLAAKPRLQSWVRLLALSVDNPDRAWSAVTIGRPARGAGFEVSHLPPLDHTAQIHLRDLVALFDAGRRQPIPLPVKSSYEYANQRRAHQSVDDAMRRVKSAWEGDDNGRDGERDEPAAVAAWGPFADLRSFGRPLPGEEYDGETTRFGALAMRVWMPLFAAERGR